MPLPKEFFDRLPERTDADLVQMIAHSEQYVPEAIAAVEAEVAKRNLSLDGVRQAADRERSALERERAERSAARAVESLSWPLLWLIFFVPFGFGLLGFLWMRSLSSRGYDLKVKQIWMITLAGFIFWGLVRALLG